MVVRAFGVFVAGADLRGVRGAALCSVMMTGTVMTTVSVHFVTRHHAGPRALVRYGLQG